MSVACDSLEIYGAVAAVQEVNQLAHGVQRLFAFRAGNQTDDAKFFLGHVAEPVASAGPRAARGRLFGKMFVQGISIAVEAAIQHVHVQTGVF